MQSCVYHPASMHLGSVLPQAGVRTLLADDAASETSRLHVQRAPTEFMCLLLKLLQLQPEKEIIVEFIKNEDYKYVRVLGKPCFLAQTSGPHFCT